MGGFGSGGRRSGAGRKKKPKHMRLIDGGAGRRRGEGGGEPPEDATAAADALPIEPPATLSPAELAVWREWAPCAHAEGTLTASTLENFVQLCQVEVDRRELRDRYQLQYDAAGEPRPLLCMNAKEEMATRREHRNLAKDVHLRMKDFKLAPFGKELTSPGAGIEAPADPLDAFTRR